MSLSKTRRYASPDRIEEIVFPEHLYGQLMAHGRRKLSRQYLPDEERERKAYGLVGARLDDRVAEVTHVVPLLKNQRSSDPELCDYFDELMDEVAVPSETPNARRGWVTDPREVLQAEREFDATGSVLLGGYHMHRVAWDGDPLRDTCTGLDTRLAESSGMWMFILSLVDPDEPILRTFFEGCNDREAVVRLRPGP